jgi:hypothetical protein
MSGLEAITDAYRADGDDGPETDLDLGGSDKGTADHFGGGGEDSPPLKGDWVTAVQLDGSTESLAAVAYSDDTERVAAAGEKRTYARNSDGSVVAEVHMKGDGSVTIARTAGSSVEVASNGAITIDAGAGTISIDAAGAISISGASVSLQTGTSLGVHLTTLHTAITAWVPAPNDGGAALKAALATYIAQPPPGP